MASPSRSRTSCSAFPKAAASDLVSAVTAYGKLLDKQPGAIPLDLADIRATLDRLVPAEAQVSAKRWSNLRSDHAAAIATSGLVGMVKTADVPLAAAWEELLAGMSQRIRAGLSRFARWASLRHLVPEVVDDSVTARFVAELEAGSLVRGLRDLHRRSLRLGTRWSGLQPSGI
jgi:hypothetical protein